MKCPLALSCKAILIGKEAEGSNMKKEKCSTSCRTTRVGGQAVIEGVRMKNQTDVALAIRKADGTIEIKKTEFHPAKEKHG